MYEICLISGRHEIKSPITGEVVEDSFFGNTVEDVLNVKKHMAVISVKLVTLDAMDLIVYVPGLTTVFQAVFAAWLNLRCSGATQSLDMPNGSLTFAHHDRDANEYVFIDALSGKVRKL